MTVSEEDAMRISCYAAAIRLGLFEETEETMLAHEMGWNAAMVAALLQPTPRTKKGNRDPIEVVKEAARVGDARFQHFVETGQLQPTNNLGVDKND